MVSRFRTRPSLAQRLNPRWHQHDQLLRRYQHSKKRPISSKLLAEPGHRVRDIGSGCGGLALYLAEHCGASLNGVTLSKEQLEIAQTRAQTQGPVEQANVSEMTMKQR
ncbi:MAG: class I SAM-dependent methyltransferase [Aestuariivirga sp.]